MPKFSRGFIFGLFCLFFMVFSMYPTIYELSKRDTIKENRTFELVHNFYTDFNFYLSRIRQGLEGNLTVHEKYTSETHNGSFIHIMYLAMGWVGKFVRVPWHRTADIYHMSRIILSLTLLWMTVEVARRSFVRFRWQVMSFFLAVTASTYPVFVHLADGEFRYGGHMPWWSVMDSLQRITFIPHLLAGQAMMVFLLFAMTDTHTMTRLGNWIFLGVIGFVLGIIFPPGAVFVVAAAFFIVIFQWYFDAKKVKSSAVITYLVSRCLPFFTIALLITPALMYLNMMTSFFPWKQLALADIIRPLPFKYPEYLLAVGPVLPIGIIGGIIALKKRQAAMLLPLAWVLTWAALLFVFQYIPQQSPLRFSEMVPHIPLAMLSTYAFMELSGVITQWLSKSMKVRENAGKYFRFGSRKIFISNLILLSVFIIPGILFASNMYHMYSSWLWQRDFVHHKISAGLPLVPTGSYVMYPLKDFVSAIVYIQDHTTRDTVILSETTAGNYIPVYAGNTVYVGHDNTVNYDEKKLFVRSFFSGMMPADQAKQWLTQENMHWIFFGPQEKEDAGRGDLRDLYPFLNPVFTTDLVTVYTF